ncbi:MAG: hypothetical protein WC554_16600, partial [Clostridia bacterium]
KSMRGGTLSAMWGGPLNTMWGGTLNDMRGGALNAMRGGTLNTMWGGTLNDMWGGTLNTMWGGTLNSGKTDIVLPKIDNPNAVVINRGVANAPRVWVGGIEFKAPVKRTKKSSSLKS